jgi:hypothetical protein
MSQSRRILWYVTISTPTSSAPGSQLIELDSRKRAPLRPFARHQRYIVSEEPDGTLVLTPAVVMSELEARLLRNNPALLAKLEESTAHPERLVRHKLTKKATPKRAG